MKFEKTFSKLQLPPEKENFVSFIVLKSMQSKLEQLQLKLPNMQNMEMQKK